MAPIPTILIQPLKLVNNYDSSIIQIRQSSVLLPNTLTQRSHGHWSVSNGTHTPSRGNAVAQTPSTDPTLTAGAIVAIVLAAIVVGALCSIPVYIVVRDFHKQRRLRLLAVQPLVQPHQIRGWSASTNDTQRTPPPTYSQSQGRQTPMIETRSDVPPPINAPLILPAEHEDQERNSASFAYNSSLFHEQYEEEAQAKREIEAERQKTLLMLEGHDVDATPYVTHVTEFAFDQFCRSMRISEPGATPEKPPPVKFATIKKAATAPDLTRISATGQASPVGSLKERVATESPLKAPELARLRGPIHQTPALSKLGGGHQSRVLPSNGRGEGLRDKSNFVPNIRFQEYLQNRENPSPRRDIPRRVIPKADWV